jgi:hypothetical protein
MRKTEGSLKESGKENVYGAKPTRNSEKRIQNNRKSLYKIEEKPVKSNI